MMRIALSSMALLGLPTAQAACSRETVTLADFTDAIQAEWACDPTKAGCSKCGTQDGGRAHWMQTSEQADPKLPDALDALKYIAEEFPLVCDPCTDATQWDATHGGKTITVTKAGIKAKFGIDIDAISDEAKKTQAEAAIAEATTCDKAVDLVLANDDFIKAVDAEKVTPSLSDDKKKLNARSMVAREFEECDPYVGSGAPAVVLFGMVLSTISAVFW